MIRVIARNIDDDKHGEIGMFPADQIDAVISLVRRHAAYLDFLDGMTTDEIDGGVTWQLVIGETETVMEIVYPV